MAQMSTDEVRFTFHHVSIKTIPANAKIFRGNLFTFHHVSIKTITATKIAVDDLDSHSTMYLLKLDLLSGTL